MIEAAEYLGSIAGRAGVEICWDIGGRIVALEHTRIDPYEDKVPNDLVLHERSGGDRRHRARTLNTKDATKDAVPTGPHLSSRLSLRNEWAIARVRRRGGNGAGFAPQRSAGAPQPGCPRTWLDGGGCPWRVGSPGRSQKGTFLRRFARVLRVDFGRYPCRYACVAPVPDGSSNQRQRYPPTRACARADENAVSLQFDSVGG